MIRKKGFGLKISGVGETFDDTRRLKPGNHPGTFEKCPTGGVFPRFHHWGLRRQQDRTPISIRTVVE